jgi:hypothetical protein
MAQFGFDWLENAYRNYPQQQEGMMQTPLHLSMNTATHRESRIPERNGRFFL